VSTTPAKFCPECGAAEPGRFCRECGHELASAPLSGVLGSAQPITPTVRPVSRADLWTGRIERALSVRVGCGALFTAALLGALASYIWEPLAVPIAAVAFVILWLAAVANDEQMAKCDACRKRVKLGASACHHCGYSRNVT
jgi:predicted amidophosphoribosyltransferase